MKNLAIILCEKYVTSIKSDGARFSAALGALLGTRIALCFQAIATMKVRIVEIGNSLAVY